MALLASSRLFRAEAMRLDWGRVIETQIEQLHRSQSPLAGAAEQRRTCVRMGLLRAPWEVED